MITWQEKIPYEGTQSLSAVTSDLKGIRAFIINDIAIYKKEEQGRYLTCWPLEGCIKALDIINKNLEDLKAYPIDEDKVIRISILKDFTEHPGLGRRELSDNSGEEFRDSLLVPALRDNPDCTVSIDLDGTAGMTYSFLEEAFAGTVRELGKEIVDRIAIVTENSKKRIQVLIHMQNANRK